VIESVYPSANLDVNVKVIVPEAVPLLLDVPMTWNVPWELVTVIVCPAVRLTVFWRSKRPGDPGRVERSNPRPKPRPSRQAV
jgi:hypothetical protein